MVLKKSLAVITVSLVLPWAGVALAGPATAATRDASVQSAVLPTATVSVRDFGAVGDGRTDDTAALQRALDATPRAGVLQLPAGGVFLHSDVLHVRRAGITVVGPGELRATRPDRSSVWVEADGVTVQDLHLTVAGVTHRYDAWEQMRVRLLTVHNTVLRRLVIDGSAAAGVYVGGAHDFLLDHLTVRDTRADGIHITGGAADGRVVSPTVVNSGDDGVAVVSYMQDGPPVARVTVSSPTVLGTSSGRGLSVVGGTDITYTDVHVERSSAAAVYIANEGAPWFTAAPVRVRVSGGELLTSNTDPTVDHGAVLVLAGAGQRPDDVVVQNLDIVDSRPTAHRSVGVITYGTAPVGVVLLDLRISGGPRAAYQGNTNSGYRLTDWTVDGKAVPDAGDRTIALPTTPLDSSAPTAVPAAAGSRSVRPSSPIIRLRSPFRRAIRWPVTAAQLRQG